MMRVLLASDEDRTRRGIAAAGERAGHEVVCATHARQAAERADLRQVDVVVVAFGHRLRSEQFVSRVRARNATIPIAVLLSPLTVAAAPRMGPRGAAAVVARPVAVTELLHRLEQLAERDRPRVEAMQSAAAGPRRELEPRGVAVMEADGPWPAIVSLAGTQ